MKSTDAPSKQAVPFGTNGPREAITATTPSGSNQASYDQGFPPITMTLKSAGGLPPKGQDMNQILFEQSSFNRYFAAGGGYVYDAAFSSAVGGYPKGAIIPSSDYSGYWINTTEDNSQNPEVPNASLTGWIPLSANGLTNITINSGLSLSTAQSAKDILILSGSINSNVSVILPAWEKSWTVYNNTTGGFQVTIKTPSGSGTVLSNGVNFIYGDGVNVYDKLSSFVLPVSRGGSGASNQADARSNFGLGSAAIRNVGNGTGQIPDMSYFTSNRSSPGWERLPDGFIIQWGYIRQTTQGGVPVSFPMVFPNYLRSIQCIPLIVGPTGYDCITVDSYDRTGMYINRMSGNSSVDGQGNWDFFWTVVGF